MNSGTAQPVMKRCWAASSFHHGVTFPSLPVWLLGRTARPPGLIRVLCYVLCSQISPPRPPCSGPGSRVGGARKGPTMHQYSWVGVGCSSRTRVKHCPDTYTRWGCSDTVIYSVLRNRDEGPTRVDCTGHSESTWQLQQRQPPAHSVSGCGFEGLPCHLQKLPRWRTHQRTCPVLLLVAKAGLHKGTKTHG